MSLTCIARISWFISNVDKVSSSSVIFFTFSLCGSAEKYLLPVAATFGTHNLSESAEHIRFTFRELDDIVRIRFLASISESNDARNCKKTTER
jgi:hypothetical protein